MAAAMVLSEKISPQDATGRLVVRMIDPFLVAAGDDLGSNARLGQPNAPGFGWSRAATDSTTYALSTKANTPDNRKVNTC